MLDKNITPKATDLPPSSRQRYANPQDQARYDTTVMLWNLCLEVRALTAAIEKKNDPMRGEW